MNAKGFLSTQLIALLSFINGVNNTTWGVVILFWAMHMYMQGTHPDAAYYFAGIGSTLLGVSHQPNPKIVNTGDNPTTTNVNTTTGA